METDHSPVRRRAPSSRDRVAGDEMRARIRGAQEHRAPQLAELAHTDVNEVPQEAPTPTPLKKSPEADPSSQPTARCWIAVESGTSPGQPSEPHRTPLMSPKCRNASATSERGCHRTSCVPTSFCNQFPTCEVTLG